MDILLAVGAIRISRDSNRTAILLKTDKTELLHQITRRDLLGETLSQIRLRSWGDPSRSGSLMNLLY
jgi:hypothetical protein